MYVVIFTNNMEPDFAGTCTKIEQAGKILYFQANHVENGDH